MVRDSGGRCGGQGVDRHQHETTPNRSAKKRGGRSDVFDEYLPLEQVQQGIKRKQLFEGTLRINKRVFFDAYVTVDGLDDDIYIPGKYKRNRAFDGDMVVVKLLEGKELEEEQEREEGKKAQKKRDDEDRQRKCMFEEDEIPEEEPEILDESTTAPPRYYGKVVCILEKKEERMFVGTLHVENPSSRTPSTLSSGKPVGSSVNTIWFKPTDKRVPFFVIPVEHAPHEFLQKPLDYSTMLWRASKKRWPIHCQYPYGKVHGSVGMMGEIAVETEALLIENGITWDIFSEEVIACLPATPWNIPEPEVAKRRDFRTTRIFSVDPLTARDLDDALSVVPLEDGMFEVGVHIADVSHFVTPGTALDTEARFRATTVYLVQKAIPMLPRLLCEELCSLNPGVDRLAFSVTWKMDSNANIIGQPWFGKSIIRSCAKLSYDHAQALIEGKDWTGLPHVEISEPYTVEDVKTDTMRLYELSLKLRSRRFENGALAINSVKLWFGLDEFGNPISTGVYQLKDSNRMIEEFMLLANMAVATRLAEAFSETALLRNHNRPKAKPLNEFVKFAASIGYTFNPESSSTLQESFAQIKDDKIRNAMQQLCIKPMQRATYFCTGLTNLNHWAHFALNVPLYTHFTSPIRRYCDLVVHRMLEAALQSESSPYEKAEVGAIAKQCNLRKFSSKDAQDASQKVYLCMYLKNLETSVHHSAEGIIVPALVYRVADRSFDVLVEAYGMEKRVWVEDSIDKGEVLACEYDEEKHSITLHWVRKNKISAQSALTSGANEGKDDLEVEDVSGDDDGDIEDGEEGVSGITAGVKKLDVGFGTSEVSSAVVSAWKNSSSETDSPVSDVGQGASSLPLSVPAAAKESTKIKRDAGVNPFLNANPKRADNSAGGRRRSRRAHLNSSNSLAQTIYMFQTVKVRITVDTSRSPVDYKLHAVYPDENPDIEGVNVEYDAMMTVSCPGIVDEAD
ncbi:hypothetical protein HDV05_008009 [Chytridiales sp. JEL 0842]|nr:hypothetical protein HDV05_008009 [Chytridiales sp. JEL 0842]